MELITTKINFKLEKLILNAFESVKDSVIKENKRINHVNIFHKNWNRTSSFCAESSCQKNWHNNLVAELMNELHKNYNIETNKIISIGFICSQVNSLNQHFHIDYNGNTETYFVPMIDLNDANGTEYIEFINKEYNINLFEELLKITNIFIDREQIIEHFNKLGIPKENYKFKFLNGKTGCMVKMPNYLFHRGQSNKGLVDRIMFQIVIAKNENCDVSDSILITDSELDDDSTLVNKLLNSRGITK